MLREALTRIAHANDLHMTRALVYLRLPLAAVSGYAAGRLIHTASPTGIAVATVLMIPLTVLVTARIRPKRNRERGLLRGHAVDGGILCLALAPITTAVVGLWTLLPALLLAGCCLAVAFRFEKEIGGHDPGDRRSRPPDRSPLTRPRRRRSASPPPRRATRSAKPISTPRSR